MEQILKGRTAIITGANQGLGLEIAKQYVRAGANLMICARDQQLLTQAGAELQLLAGPAQSIHALKADISNEHDVQMVVDRAQEHFGSIHILVNNAGVYGPKGAIEEVNWQDWIDTIRVNLYGSVLMCRAVLPLLKKINRGKIVQLSGGGATNPLPHLSAYAVSKAAIIRFIETLAEEVRESHIDVNAIAPGALNTRMLDEVLDAGPDKVGQNFYERALMQRESGGTPLEKGANLAEFLGSPLSDGITGKLISAVWDPWASLPEHLADLNQTDIYTLRRIVPKDRAKEWGEA